MSLTGGLVLYATVWFVVLFLLLPFGHQSQEEAGEVVPGTPPGAPHEPPLLRKAIWATIWTTVLFLVIFAVIKSGWIGREEILNFNRFT